MTVFPDEIWTNILDYAEPVELVNVQKISHRFLKLGRDPSLWRNKVFEKAPSAAHSHATDPDTLSTLTGALGGLSLGEPLPSGSFSTRLNQRQTQSRGLSQRAKAILEWDTSDASENINWYSEYIARHAPLSTVWPEPSATQQEIRGVALLGHSDKAVGTLEDGGVVVWDLTLPVEGQRRLTQKGRSKSGLLFEDTYSLGKSSMGETSKPLSSAVDNISIDVVRKRAYCAIENVLNEVDLERMEIVSQTKFAWPITALSQTSLMDYNLTVGTSFSLHLHDTRSPYTQLVDRTDLVDNAEDPKIAFLQNHSKSKKLTIDQSFSSSSDSDGDTKPFARRLMGFARIEPGPQSILHRGENEIVIAGRLPSILFYDRRNFSTPRTGIHSGARLSAMTILPFAPARASSPAPGDSTLVVCGEYGGRGSLEMYQLPWEKRSQDSASASSQSVKPFAFRNRQEASSSKLLSVATQGTRIVFSDSDGMLKWVERDGRGLARRWNVNSSYINERGIWIPSDKVARKIIPLQPTPSSSLPMSENDSSSTSTSGDNDLLIWTGENIGIVTTRSKPGDDHADLVRAFERGMDLNKDSSGRDQDRDRDSQQGRENAETRELQYATMMRRALERQADERRWMSRFGLRRG